MATVLNTLNYASDWLKWEQDNYYSRDTAIIASGAGILSSGTVLGRITLGAATQAAKSGGNTGNGTLALDGSTPVLANAKPGVYSVRFTAATTFRVTDPAGAVLGDGANGAAFADRIKFVTTAGGTPFVAGDGFDVTIAAGSGKRVPASLTALDGSAVAESILFDRKIDATSADQKAIVVSRDAIVSHAGLIYGATINDATKRATANGQLGAVGIIVREGA